MAAVLPDAEPSDSQPTPALALDADARPPLRPRCVLPAAAAATGAGCAEQRLGVHGERRLARWRGASGDAVLRRGRSRRLDARDALAAAARAILSRPPRCTRGAAASSSGGPLGRQSMQAGARRRTAEGCAAVRCLRGREETLARRPCLPSFALVLAATRASGAGRRAQGAPSHPPAASRQPPPLLLHPGRSGRELPDGWAQGKRRLRCSTGTATQRRRRGLPTSCANKRRRRVAAPCTA
jgi:hypothetical protein